MTTGQAQAKPASGKGQSSAYKRGRKLGPMNSHKLTSGTPFPLGTSDTVMLAKCRQELQFIVSSFKNKQKKKKLNREKGHPEYVKGRR